MNYYIQGDAAKADKIKAAFEKLGYDVTGFDMCNDNILFFTYKLQTGANVISTTNAHLYTANIIKTHPDYKELKLPAEPKFKVGDWITDNYCSGKVIALTDDAYLLDNGQGIPFSCEHNAHLWTIADAKDGDVLVAHEVIGLFKEIDGLNIRCHFSYHYMNTPMVFTNELHNKRAFRPATKDECELLFAKMKEAGYKLDADKKELRKIQPHYDILNFKPFDKVLVRDADDGKWRCNWFSHYSYSGDGGVYRFVTTKCGYAQCIPFEGNEHLLGTTDMPSEEFINW